jgi:hypothetical protein
MAQFIKTLWCDIHAEVKARDGQHRATVQLSDWFHIVVDGEADALKNRISEKIIDSDVRTGGLAPVDEQESVGL